MRRISVFGLAFTLSLFVSASAHADCKPELVAMSGESGPAQSDAERVARVTWETVAARTYGNAYAKGRSPQDRMRKTFERQLPMLGHSLPVQLAVRP